MQQGLSAPAVAALFRLALRHCPESESSLSYSTLQEEELGCSQLLERDWRLAAAAALRQVRFHHATPLNYNGSVLRRPRESLKLRVGRLAWSYPSACQELPPNQAWSRRHWLVAKPSQAENRLNLRPAWNPAIHRRSNPKSWNSHLCTARWSAPPRGALRLWSFCLPQPRRNPKLHGIQARWSRSKQNSLPMR